jgi:hypothetical protein
MSAGIKSTQGQPSGELMVNGETVIVFRGDSLRLPFGITSDRPSPPTAGMIRFNTDTSKFEGYDGSNWVNLN